ncbi:MAG: type II secretion system protein GspL [Colwellia sp.]
MAETLYIRLGSKANDVISWLILDSLNDEIIASGELKNAEALSQLTEKAKTRPVYVFVPGCDFHLSSLKVPGNSQRAIRQATPYMVEDELGQEVEQLFFAYADLPVNALGHNSYFAAVEKTLMNSWIDWLEQADIQTSHMLPDFLAMPFSENTASAITLETSQAKQVLFRQGQWHGFTVDAFAWQHIAMKLAVELGFETEVKDAEAPKQSLSSESIVQDEQKEDKSAHVTINAYSPLQYSDNLPVSYLPEELPLALLAQQADYKFFNVLQGEYKVKKSHSTLLKTWSVAAGVALFALLLNFAEKGVALYQVNNKQVALEAQIISVYKKAFPQTKRVRIGTIKSQLNQKIAQLGGKNNSAGFLAMLAKIQPAFAEVSDLKPETLKYDGKRKEIRLQAIASDYQKFDQFKSSIEKLGFVVKAGSQNNQGDSVTGSFNITASQTSGGQR